VVGGQNANPNLNWSGLEWSCPPTSISKRALKENSKLPASRLQIPEHTVKPIWKSITEILLPSQYLRMIQGTPGGSRSLVPLGAEQGRCEVVAPQNTRVESVQNQNTIDGS